MPLDLKLLQTVCTSADRTAWLAARRGLFTGSEAAALLGQHEYVKLDAVLHEKRTGESDFDQTQDHVRQGTLFEPSLADYTEAVCGVVLQPVGVLCRDPGCAALGATPDYVTADASAWGLEAPANVQLKWTKARRHADHSHGDRAVAKRLADKTGPWGPAIPSYIWWQVQAEVAVLEPWGIRTSFVVAYHRRDIPGWGARGDRGTQLGVYRVDRDDQAIELLRAAALRHQDALWRADD